MVWLVDHGFVRRGLVLVLTWLWFGYGLVSVWSWFGYGCGFVGWSWFGRLVKVRLVG